MPTRDVSMRMQFKDTCIQLAEQDEKIVLIFGDISVFLFREYWGRWPERFFNVGICEATLVSLAAGLSARGFHPFVHTINPFLSDRAYEQIKLDMVYNQFGGNLVTCGGSYDYAWDGATHHCYTDVAQFRRLPNMEVMQPGSNEELDALLHSQYANGKTSYYRIAHDEHGMLLPITFGKGVAVRDEAAAVTVVTAGPILHSVMQACEGLAVNVLYYPTIKPFDHELLARFADTRILVVEEAFGLHDAVCEQPDLRCKRYGLPDQFTCCYGKLEDIRAEIGMTSAGIRAAVESRLLEAANG